MESELLNVTPVELSLTSLNAKEERSDIVGLHVLTADGAGNIDGSSNNMIGTLPMEENSQSVITVPTLSTEISSSNIENAILMETPRGLVLTVSDNINNLAYSDETSHQDVNSRQLLSCIPVSLYSACDATSDVDTSSGYNDTGITEEAGTCEIAERLEVNGDVVNTVVPVEVTASIGDASLSINNGLSINTTKRKGGWPKGKRRKKEPMVTGPRAPLTGYVIYAMDRRREIKQNHPEISFPEVTKILGQEWSNMPHDVKEKYLAAADADKKRYREELKAFKSSDTYQSTVRKKMMFLNGGNLASDQESGDLMACVEEEDNSNELHCKVCDMYFSNSHNKQEHMYGRTHLQAVTGVVEEKILRHQAEEQALLGGALVVSEETQEEFTPLPSSSLEDSSKISSAPVDIHGFMTEFINKNYEREQEISLLKKSLDKDLQTNVTMCKEIQELQDYQVKLEEEIQSLTSTTSSLIAQNDALKMVPTLFGVINL